MGEKAHISSRALEAAVAAYEAAPMGRRHKMAEALRAAHPLLGVPGWVDDFLNRRCKVEAVLRSGKPLSAEEMKRLAVLLSVPSEHQKDPAVQPTVAVPAADSCPICCPLVIQDEIDVAMSAMHSHTAGLLSGQGASNLAYAVLVALRSAHFEWHRRETDHG